MEDLSSLFASTVRVFSQALMIVNKMNTYISF